MKTATLILLLAISSFAQSVPCDLTLKDTPTVQQMRLGMDEKDVSKIYPIIKPNGVIPASEYIKGRDVRMMFVEFYKNKLSSFSVFYRRDAAWRDATEFVQAISGSLGLPILGWRELGSPNSSYISCMEFDVTASIDTNKDGGPMLIFADTLARKAKIAEEKQTEENKKRTFKP